MLLDSNIIIYSAQAEHGLIRQFIVEYSPVVSAISIVEVLGFYRMGQQEELYLQAFFESAIVLEITHDMVTEAQFLRRQRPMTLGDALIAGTCLVHNLTLVTRNTNDFVWAPNLRILDPFSPAVEVSSPPN